MTIFYVILGATIGAPSRYLIDQYLRKYLKYPVGITLINVFGSLVLGLSIGSGEKLSALFGIGFAGAFTTWSTFILDIYLAYELKRYKSAALNLTLSTVLGLGAVWIGINIAS